MVEVQAVVQAQGLAVGDKPRVEPLAADPRSALGGPAAGFRSVPNRGRTSVNHSSRMSGVQSHMPSAQARCGISRRRLLPCRDATSRVPHRHPLIKQIGLTPTTGKDER
jgi:hypothetical protein